MELDDLKEKWKASVQPSSVDIRATLERKVSALKSSGRGIRRVFMIEMSVVVFIYVGVILMMLFIGEKLMTYMYKLIVITGILSIPAIVRLYKSQKWINGMDYAKDVRSNMIAFLQYYNNTLRVYQWSTYILVVVLLIVMFTDHDFLELSLTLKVAVAAYISLTGILARPYIRATYGRRTSIFENFLRE